MQLSEAFDVHQGAIVTVVGGGGKTSLVFALAAEAAARGERAIATTTTKFTLPAGYAGTLLVEAGPAEVSSAIALAPKGAITVLHAGRGARGRLMGLEPELLGGLDVDLITVEGDGSAHRMFKAPGAHEPVIPPDSTHVVVCVGLAVLGLPLDDTTVHRSSLAAALGLAQVGEPVTADIVTAVLLHADGGRKHVPPKARLMALLNGPPGDEHRRLGEHIAARLVYGGYERAVVATAHAGLVHSVVR